MSGIDLTFRTLQNTTFPFQIEVDLVADLDDITTWCEETFGEHNVFQEYYCIRLKTQEHLTWFKLRWLTN